MPNSSHRAADSADFVLWIKKQQIWSWAAPISHGSKPWHVLLCEWCWACPTQLGGEHKFPFSAPNISAYDPRQPCAVSPACRTKSVTGLCLQKYVIIDQESINAKATNHFPLSFCNWGKKTTMIYLGSINTEPDKDLLERFCFQLLHPGLHRAQGKHCNHMDKIPQVIPHCPTACAVIYKYKD